MELRKNPSRLVFPAMLPYLNMATGTCHQGHKGISMSSKRASIPFIKSLNQVGQAHQVTSLTFLWLLTINCTCKFPSATPHSTISGMLFPHTHIFCVVTDIVSAIVAIFSGIPLHLSGGKTAETGAGKIWDGCGKGESGG